MAYLIDNGADINKLSVKNLSALTEAVFASHVPIVKTLLKLYADVSVVDHSGKTALNYAAANGNVEIIKLLVAHGADVNRQTEFVRTLFLKSSIIFFKYS